MKEAMWARCLLERCFDITALHTAFIRTMETGMGMSSAGEFHNFWELMLVLDGEMMVATGKEVFTVKKNCMIIHPPMAFHRHFNSAEQHAKILVISFDARELPIIRNSVFVLESQEIDEFVAIEELIYEYYEVRNNLNVVKPRTMNVFAGQEIRSRLELLLINTFSGKTVPRKNVNSDYKRIVKYVKENLHRSLTLSDIADALNMSVSNMKKIFSGYSGMGIMTYYNHCRIEEAVRFLESGLSVKETADTLGYSSQSAFCTAFKNTLGFPPSKVRK